MRNPDIQQRLQLAQVQGSDFIQISVEELDAMLEKHEEEIAELRSELQQAEDDIANLHYEIEHGDEGY